MIALASDHAGFELKGEIARYLDKRGVAYTDFGTHTKESCDYPQYGLKAAQAVATGQCERGILVCGTGVGISIVANKVRGVRCVNCSEPYSAVLSRRHNNTNMLSLGARVAGPGLALAIVEQWLGAQFEGGRHQKRVDMISELELSAQGSGR